MKMYYSSRLFLSSFLLVFSVGAAAAVKIPDTGQNRCYSDSRAVSCPGPGGSFFGQDAQYQGPQPAYRDNGNGTVTDLNTGLVWSKAVSPNKLSLDQAQRAARQMSLGGHTDWRIPTIKELYSLIDFRGYTGFSGRRSLKGVPSNAIPFINTDYFDFLYGATGERYIDAQWLSSTKYVSTTLGGAETLFGVNFADGRIKGYGYRHPGRSRDSKKFYVRYVRGGPYGQNQFKDNGDGTITDHATGFTWAKMDSGRGMTWKEALAYAEQQNLAGHGDWRLPNAKELQYIVDYSRSPDTSNSAAIDPVFQSSSIVNEQGQKDYPAYWTSTTHLDGPRPGNNGVYIAFGRAMGRIQGRIMDVHGAGAQRSDPKAGSPVTERGPQGDAVRINNYVRIVRGGGVRQADASRSIDRSAYPYNVNPLLTQPQGDGKNQSRQPGTLQGPWGDTDQMSPPGGGRMTSPGGGQQMGPGGAGQMPQGDFGTHFVERLDRDGDGRVSRSEFDGPSDRFDDHDQDGDGYISKQEIRNAPPPPPPGGFGGGMR
jgi:hypothetical protein